jgi:hypothetical protein
MQIRILTCLICDVHEFMLNYLLKVADVTGRQRVHFLQKLHNFVSYTSFQHNIIKLYEGKVNL